MKGIQTKKWIVGSMVLVLAGMLTMGGCAKENKGNGETASGSMPAADNQETASGGENTGPVRIDWLMGGDNTVGSETEVLEEIRQRTGIDLRIQYINRTDYSTKLNALIASDSLPDIFSSDGQTALDLRDAGKILDFSEYLPEFGPDILASYGAGELDKLVINWNGGVYGLNSRAGAYESSLSIRKDWLDKLGLSMPSTLEELYDVMYAFTYNDPDGDGENNTFGYSPTVGNGKTFEHIFAAYGIPFQRDTVLEDGTVTAWIKHPNFLKVIGYFRKMYQEGVMNPDFATVAWADNVSLWWNGRVGTFDFQSVGTTNNWFPGRYTFGVTEDPSDTFAFVRLGNEDTGKPVGGVREYPSLQNYAALISAGCEHPEEAVRVLNYMMYTPEGQDLCYLGIEGKMYRWTDRENGKYERIGDYADDTVHRAAGAFVYGYGWTAENAETRVMNKMTQEEIVTAKERAIDYAFFAQSFEAETEYGTILDSIEMECFTSLVVSTGDIEAEYLAFLQEWEDNGGKEYEKEAAEQYGK